MYSGTSVGTPSRSSRPNFTGARYASAYGFHDLRSGREPVAQAHTDSDTPVATRPVYDDAAVNHFPGSSGRRASELSAERTPLLHVSRAKAPVEPLSQPENTQASYLESRGVSSVYRRKTRGERQRDGISWLSSSSRRTAQSMDEFFDETPEIDFNDSLPYYASAGQQRKGRQHAASTRLVGVVVPPDDTGLASPEKQSRHRAQPMVDAPPLAPTLRVQNDIEAMRIASASPYHRSVADSQRLLVNDAPGAAFSPALGTRRADPSAQRPAEVLAAERDRSRRSIAIARDQQWSTRVGSFHDGSRGVTAQPADHDDSGDDRDAEMVDLPPPPSVSAAAEASTMSTTSRLAMKASAPHTPWQFHPHMDIPLSLILQRGVSIYDHQSVIEYHMHAAFLNDIGLARAGDALVKYPRRSGMPHERHVALELMPVATGDAAFLTWRKHAGAMTHIDRVPLAHLVGVTADDSSGTFHRFAADPRTADGRRRAEARLAKPHDAMSTPSPLPHHTPQLAGLDTTMVGAAPPGTMLVGPTVEDARRMLLPRAHCFSLWFVNPRTKEARSLDFVAYQHSTWARWVDTMRAVVAINNVSLVPSMDDADRREPSADEAQRMMDEDDAMPSRLSAPAPGADGASATAFPHEVRGLGRTQEMMRFALHQLEGHRLPADLPPGDTPDDATAAAANESAQ